MTQKDSRPWRLGKGLPGAGTGCLRITSGVLRGRLVAAPPGEGTRPLLTRVRKSLADLLRPRLPGARVLDLFAGSGAIGFELLSNGAEHCVFNELDGATSRLIRTTAAHLGVAVEVYNREALEFLHSTAGGVGPFDVVVVAPPYGLGLQQQVLERCNPPVLLTPAGVLVVQRDVAEPPGRVEPARLVRVDSRTYGRTVFEFYARTPGVKE